MAATETLERLSAVALNGSAPGPCGLTLLAVRKTSDPGHVWLLDTKRDKLCNPVDDSTLARLTEERMITPLRESREVCRDHLAFYVKQDFLDLYKEVCGVALSDDGASQTVLEKQSCTVFIGNESRLRELRRDTGAQFLLGMDNRIQSQALHAPEAFFSNDSCFLETIENWARNGALCVGSSGDEALYWEFHQRIAAALTLMPGESGRLRRIYDLQVRPYYPDFTYERYAEEARGVTANWRETASWSPIMRETEQTIKSRGTVQHPQTSTPWHQSFKKSVVSGPPRPDGGAKILHLPSQQCNATNILGEERTGTDP
ncbi:MAG: hypothetical protein HQL97_08090 [Magnetococcales bacterium]|nr:hypothetical protein [Magnetococcales bacterium]